MKDTLPSTSLLPEHLAYFDRGKQANADFWASLGGRPTFQDRTVIDVGCGHGSLCVELAEAGARRVVGLDLNRELIEFGVKNVRTNFPHLGGKVRFECCDLGDWSREEVDCFVSKATFEHIIDLPSVLAEMRLRLKPGGRIYTGFDPLWPSPFGGHGRIHKHLPLPWLPWGHLLVTEKYILQRVNRTREQPVHSIDELGLNKLSVHDYRRIFRESGLRVLTFRVNWPAGSMRGKMLTLLGKLPFLSKYMAYSVYAVLEK